MCCDGYLARPEDVKGICPACSGPVDDEGNSTEEGCCYSPPVCETCNDCPCDGSC